MKQYLILAAFLIGVLCTSTLAAQNNSQFLEFISDGSYATQYRTSLADYGEVNFNAYMQTDMPGTYVVVLHVKTGGHINTEYPYNYVTHWSNGIRLSETIFTKDDNGLVEIIGCEDGQFKIHYLPTSETGWPAMKRAFSGAGGTSGTMTHEFMARLHKIDPVTQETLQIMIGNGGDCTFYLTPQEDIAPWDTGPPSN